MSNFDYRFVGNEVLFSGLSNELIEKTLDQIVITTDLGRLHLMQKVLAEGYKTVIWCDADFLIFQSDKFILVETDFALGREVWIRLDNRDRLNIIAKFITRF